MTQSTLKPDIQVQSIAGIFAGLDTTVKDIYTSVPELNSMGTYVDALKAAIETEKIKHFNVLRFNDKSRLFIAP